jgi:hypothetical protein
MRRVIIFVALLAGLPGTASAHAFLDHAVPAVGAMVSPRRDR